MRRCIKIIIDLESIITENERILSGRSIGKNARTKFCLDVIDKNDELGIHIIVPNRIWSINSSFFLGCFEKSIIELGEDLFRKKYKFECDSVINTNIEDGISRALKIKKEMI